MKVTCKECGKEFCVKNSKYHANQLYFCSGRCDPIKKIQWSFAEVLAERLGSLGEEALKTTDINSYFNIMDRLERGEQELVIKRKSNWNI